MFSEYTRLAVDEKPPTTSRKGRYSAFGALIFALAGICAVGKLLHEHSFSSIEESVAETPVGACVVNTGLAQINKVGVGLEAELQTRRWYSPKVKWDEAPNQQDVNNDFSVKWSCAWGYKHLLGSVYWSEAGEVNDESTLAFQITGEQHCVIELITPPRDVHNEAADRPVMLAAILGIMRMRHVMNTYKDLTLGQAFALLNAKKETNGATDPKDKKGWSLIPQYGKYRVVWNSLSLAHTAPGTMGPTAQSIKDILKDPADFDDPDATFFSECTAPAEPNFEYGNPSKLVWQANVNVPIFFWDINTVKPAMLKEETSFPLATLKAFGADRTAIEQIDNPIVRSLVGFWRNAELTYDGGREDGYVKNENVRKTACPSRNGVLPPNPKNYNPWYNKANLVGKADGGWTQGATARDKFETMFDKTKPNIGFDREIDPALYNQVPYVVVESRWGTSGIIQKLKSDTSTWDASNYKYAQYSTQVEQFFFQVTKLQDATKYGGHAECFPQ